MSEKPVAADRRAACHHRPLRLLVILILLFLAAPGALFFFMSTGVVLPRIRIEYDYDRCGGAHSSARIDQPPPSSPSPSPPPPNSVVDGAAEEPRPPPPPPPRQLTDPPLSLGPVAPDYDERRAKWLRDNPRFPAFVAPGRPRVLVVSGSSPRRCSVPDGDHMLLRAFKNKVDYCRVHGFDIFYSTAVLDAELNGFWTKLPLLRSLMVAHPETEFLWWMDSDLMLTDMLAEPPWGRYARHNLVVPGWDDKVYVDRSWLGINAGSFIIRNCRWGGETLLENSYSLHGFWAGIVDKYEEMRRPGAGEPVPLVTHFVGCKPCSGEDSSYDAAVCRRGMERALNFADDQVLSMYGFGHESLNTTAVLRVRNDTGGPLDAELGRLLHPAFRAANL
ncbi:unnamed protein product [Urochloa decumbens]|uniref:Uncharacterized protein n=1 Tax=Urochloa decumbens TaxID=240449 RepID=A0ABC8ZWC3_9POAL